ncbi:MAG TPA: hypothetical protein EYQ81_05935 [Sneathiellales bacterium]|nr:hypothetical protein [Sneathiellales bacterium]
MVEQIEPIKPDIAVDATGPFQMYGDDPCRIVRAAIACNADYLDLADGSDFVLAIGHFYWWPNSFTGDCCPPWLGRARDEGGYGLVALG